MDELILAIGTACFINIFCLFSYGAIEYFNEYFKGLKDCKGFKECVKITLYVMYVKPIVDCIELNKKRKHLKNMMRELKVDG